MCESLLLFSKTTVTAPQKSSHREQTGFCKTQHEEFLRKHVEKPLKAEFAEPSHKLIRWDRRVVGNLCQKI